MHADDFSVLKAGLVLMGAMPLAAQASTPSTLWRGVDRVFVACDSGGAAAPAARQLCRDIVAEAGRRSPYPVAMLSPAIRATARDVVLRVDVRLSGAAGSSALIFSIQPIRDDPRSESAMPAGGRPARGRVAIDSNGRAAATAMAVADGLDRVLPWRRRGGGVR